MLAVIQMWKGIEKHIDRHTSADNKTGGTGPPEFSHQIESFLLCQIPSCFTAGPRIYTGLTAPDTFLLHSRAPDLHWTFPDLPEHRCFYLSFFPFVPKSILPWSRDPGRAQNVLPVVWVPGRERRLLETMQLAIGEFIPDSSQGLLPSPRMWGRKTPSPSSLWYLLGQKKAAGSWRKQIGYTVARQFLLAQRGAFSFPLIDSLFLARHMLIG